MGKVGETKPRKRKLIIYDTLAGLFVVIGGIFFSISHVFAITGCVVLFIGLIISAAAFRLTLINYNSRHFVANCWGVGIGLLGTVLCAYLVWFELNSGQPEAKLLPVIATDRTPQLSSELDDSLRRTFFVLQFSETNSFKSLIPFDSDLKLSKSMAGNEVNSFSFTVNSFDSTMQRKSSYDTVLSINGNIVQRLQIIFDTNQIAFVSIPILLACHTNNPFKTIRDFNGCMLQVSASENIVGKLQSVEFIANGWCLFHADIHPSLWKRKGNSSMLLNQSGNMMFGPVPSFSLNTHGNLKFYANLSGPPFSLGDNLLFWGGLDYENWIPRE